MGHSPDQPVKPVFNEVDLNLDWRKPDNTFDKAKELISQGPEGIFRKLENYAVGPRIQAQLSGLTAEDYARKQMELKEKLHLIPELIPAVLAREVLEYTSAMAAERAEAAACFLQDIYSRDPKIFRANPDIEFAVKSCVYFEPELVGSPFADSTLWDFEIAMDWALVKKDGVFGIEILESDSCGVGGIFELAHLYLTMKRLYEYDGNFAPFLNGASYLEDHFDRMNSFASRYGSDGVAMFYAEECSEVEFTDPESPLRAMAEAKGIVAGGSWNKEMLEYDSSASIYKFQKKPIHAINLRYYPGCLDSEAPIFSRMAEEYQKGAASHLINGFWKNYFGGGFRNFYLNNPIGAEVFVDKAIAAYIPEMVRFYLGREPLYPRSAYRHFHSQGQLNNEFLNEVFSDLPGWVLKSRSSFCQGAGVFIGEELASDVTGKLQQDMKNLIMSEPGNWIAQPYFEDCDIELMPGRKRCFELRNVTQTFGGKAFPINQLLMRSAPAGQKRGVSSNKDASIIPLLVAQD